MRLRCREHASSYTFAHNKYWCVKADSAILFNPYRGDWFTIEQLKLLMHKCVKCIKFSDRVRHDLASLPPRVVDDDRNWREQTHNMKSSVDCLSLQIVTFTWCLLQVHWIWIEECERLMRWWLDDSKLTFDWRTAKDWFVNRISLCQRHHIASCGFAKSFSYVCCVYHSCLVMLMYQLAVHRIFGSTTDFGCVPLFFRCRLKNSYFGIHGTSFLFQIAAFIKSLTSFLTLRKERREGSVKYIDHEHLAARETEWRSKSLFNEYWGHI